MLVVSIKTPTAADVKSAPCSPSKRANPLYIALPDISRVHTTVNILIKLVYNEYTPNSAGVSILVKMGVNMIPAPRESSADATDHPIALIFRFFSLATIASDPLIKTFFDLFYRVRDDI